MARAANADWSKLYAESAATGLLMGVLFLQDSTVSTWVRQAPGLTYTMLSSHRLVPPPSRVNNNAVVTLLSLTAAPWNHITTDPTHSPILHPLSKTDAVAAPPAMLDPALSGGFTSDPSMELDPLLDASLVKRWSHQKVGTPTRSATSRAADPFREGAGSGARAGSPTHGGGGWGSDVGASPKGSAATDEGWGDGGDDFDDLLKQHLSEPAAEPAADQSGDNPGSTHSAPQTLPPEQQPPTAGSSARGPTSAGPHPATATGTTAAASKNKQNGSDRVIDNTAALGPSSLLLMGVSDEGHIWQWDVPWPCAAAASASGAAATGAAANVPDAASSAAASPAAAAGIGPGSKQADQEKAGETKC